MYLNYNVHGTNSEELEKSAFEVVKSVKPKWDISQVSIKHYSEGLTNQLIGFYYENFDDQILIRVSGIGTELFIDRQAEVETVEILHKKGIGPELLAVFENGFCYEFTPGRPITFVDVVSKDVYPKIAEMMASMHKIETKDKSPKLFSLIKRFIELIPTDFIGDQLERTKKRFFSKEYLSMETSSIEKVIEGMTHEIVFSHNDLLLNNIILNEKEGTVRFIDYEYAFPNYLYHDVGSHFCEFAGVDEMDYSLYPNADFARKFLRCYISTLRNIPADEVSYSEVEIARKRANVFSLAAHLLWGCWAILQASMSTIDFDYLRFGINRLSEYERRKEEFLSALL